MHHQRPPLATLMKFTGLALLAFARLCLAEAVSPSGLVIESSPPNEVLLSWTAENLRPYQLESSTNLVDWSALGEPVVGNGVLVSHSDGPFAESGKFYRLRVGAVRPGFDDYFRERNDDLSSGLIPIGFPISLFGKTETHCYVNNNGNITFSQQLGSYTPNPLQNLGFTIIAPFWADVDTRPLGSDVVRYSHSTETVGGRPAFGVNWVDVGYYDFHDEKLNSFQLIFIERNDTGAGNFDIEFNYNRILWETGDASSGVAGYGGSPSRSGLTNGVDRTVELVGSGRQTIQLDTVPTTGEPNYLTGLIYRSRNSDIPGRYVFQVRGGVVLGTLSVNAGPDQFLGQGVTSTTLAGTASDPAGGSVTVHWTVREGPSGISFSDPDILDPTVTIPSGAKVVLQLTTTSVSDPTITASDIMRIN